MADTDVTPAEAASLDRAGKYSNTVYQEGANDYGLRGDGYLINFPGGLNDLGIVGRMVARIGAWIAAAAPGLVAASQNATDQAEAAADSASLAGQKAQLATDQAGAAAVSADVAGQKAQLATDQAGAAAGSATLAGQYATAAGGAISAVRLAWDAATADADPGNGKLRANNAAPAAATALYLDNLDAAGASIATVLDRWGASTNAVKGTLRIAHRTDPAKWLEYQVTGAVVDGGGYRKVAVTGGTGPGGFAAGDPVAVGVARAGDAGVTPGGDATATPNTLAQRTGDGSLVGNHLYARTSDGSTNGSTIVAIGSNADILDAYFQMNNSGNATAPAGARGLATVVNTGAYGIYTGRLSPTVQFYMDPTTKQFTFYKSVNPSPVTVPFSSTVTLDFASSNRFDLTATGNFTLANPSGMKPGQVVVLNVTSTIANIVVACGSFFKTKGGAGVALSTTAGARDKVIMECIAAGVVDITVQKDWK